MSETMRIDQVVKPMKTNFNLAGARLLRRILGKWQLYALLILPVVWLLVFRYYPMYGAQIAFRDFLPGQAITDSPWVGLKNFERFFQSPVFTTLLFNTLGLSLYSIVVAFPFPILLALSLNQVRMQFFKQAVQMITYAPNFISTVVMVGIILQFLDVRSGPVNLLLQALGLPTVNFMGDAALFPSIYVWTGVWQFAGFESIIYIASLTSVDPALHEAAVVDGASRLQRIWYIDLPGILPVVVVMLILKMGQVLSISFEKVFLLQNPLNLSVSEIITTYIYKVGIMGGLTNFSFTAAIGLFNSLIGLILVLSAQYISKRLTGSGLW